MKSKRNLWMSVGIAVVALSFMAPTAVLAGEAPVQITFVADRTLLQPGQCALLEWHIEGGFMVQLNGLQVERAGQKKACPLHSMPYTLMVDAGYAMEVREILVEVAGSGQPPQAPPPQPGPQPAPQSPAPQPAPQQPGVTINFRADRTQLKPGECTTLRWDVEHAKEVYLDGQGVVGHSARQVCPQAAHTYVLHVVHAGGKTERKVTIHVNGGGSPNGNPRADLAVTDLYADKQPQGKVWVRVTNHGPATLTNTTVEMKCNAYGKPLVGSTPWSHVESPWLQTISLSPGQTATFPTKVIVDTSKYAYDVRCTVGAPAQAPAFADPNAGNNLYAESISAKAPSPGPAGKRRADLAVTDLYPTKLRGGRLFARITNRGPATLNNVTVQLVCGGAGWNGGAPTVVQSQRAVSLSLSRGQTAAFDTGIAVNIDQFNYYEMTCRVQGGPEDPNPSNNAYSERIP